MQKFCLIFILSLLVAFSATGTTIPGLSAQQPWKLEIEDKKERISVYYRTLKSGNLEFKGVIKIKTSLNSLVALLHDVDSMPDWVYNVEHASVLKKISEVEGYSYVINSSHFPLSKRDSIVHTIIKQDPESLAITITGQSAPDYIPESPNYVRLTLIQSFWQFTPLNNGMVEIVFQGLGEPGGNIAANISHSRVFRWIAKKWLWELPMISLRNLKNEVKKNKYHRIKYNFITEPKY